MKPRNAERDPDAIGCELTINAIVQGVSEPAAVGSNGHQKFTVLLDITKNPKYPEQLEVEYFGKDLPAWFSDLLAAEGEMWRFRGKASSRPYKDKFYTRVTIFWAGRMTNQSAVTRREPVTPPPFDNAPIPPPPRQEYQEEIPF